MHVLEDWADESLYWYEVYLRFALPANAKVWAAAVAKHDAAPIRLTAPLTVPRAMGQALRAQGTGRKSEFTVLRELERHLEAVEGLLGAASYLVGESLTLADISVFAQLYCVGETPEGRRAIDGHESVQKWMARVAALTD